MSAGTCVDMMPVLPAGCAHSRPGDARRNAARYPAETISAPNSAASSRSISHIASPKLRKT